MCGIAGAFRHGLSRDNALETAKRMSDALAHRGPDGQGSFVDSHILLGHRRLAIIDVEGSAQPLSNPTRGTHLVFNGEIYNYLELRKELEARGASFRTQGDTEVVLKLLELEGEQGLHRLRGMFAIAFYDEQKCSLLLARDTFGKKPLYVWQSDKGTVLFASQPSAFLQYEGFEKVLNHQAALSNIALGYLPGQEWLWEGVTSIEPGTWKRFTRNGNAQQGDFLTFEMLGQNNAPSGSEAHETFIKRFEQACERRLVSDVKLCTWLSGGLDSNAVAACSKARIKDAITLIPDQSMDESSLAAAGAEHYGMQLHKVRLQEDSVASLFEECSKTICDPLGDGSLIPFYALAKATRDAGFKVALGGDGADEVLHGYQTFNAVHHSQRLNWLPPSIFSLFACMAGPIPEGKGYFNFGFKLKRYLRGMSEKKERRNALWMAAWSEQELLSILHPNIQEQLRRQDYDPYAEQIAIAQNALQETDNDFKALSYELIRSYLRSDILIKADRASMACSVELRSPFLDVDLVDFALSLPQSMLFSNGKGKVILRNSMKSKMPDILFHQKKQGFSIPYDSWLRGPLRPLVDDRLSRKALEGHPFLSTPAVDEIVRKQRKRSGFGRSLFSLLAYRMWERNWQN